jgi:endonuclease YncB( thermonuclease family)
MSGHPPAGWFPDPEGFPGQERYWDGQGWSEHRRYTTPGPAGSTALAPAGGHGWIGRHKKLSAVLAVLAFLLLIGVVIGEEEDSTETASSTASDEDDPAGGEAGEPPAEEATQQEPTPTPEPDETAKPSQEPNPEPKPKPKAKAKPPPPTFVVTRVVDGDTVELGSGDTVRLVGIDTPEVGSCGADRAAASLERLVLNKRVRLTVSDEDHDRYGRLLRYVDVGPQDAGLRLIKSGLATARYDSRDGYGFHTREPVYISADRGSRNVRCAPPPSPRPPPSGGGNCAAGYRPCIPPSPPDLDCGDVDGPISVSGSDPHALDADGDGVACE